MALPNRQNVPKFGNWTEDTPFTHVFEKASRSKKDTTNMSNPREYPEMNPNHSQNRNHNGHVQPPNHNVKPRHERFSSRDETELRPFEPSPAHSERNNRVRAPPTPETYNHHQSYGGGCKFGNPSQTNRRQPYDPPPPPVQPRPIRNLRGRSSERVATIPPFPGSGSDQNQSYTLIFDKVKEDKKQSGALRSYNGTAHSTPTRPIYDQHHQPLPSSPKGCCFPSWSRKGRQ
ncbi:hypothetical protein EUTSA_v10004864mg [Eutrema salsugineum]|uniref:RIN4 pathogenic type III effector avirulence factor Avr cleavage site domain-containing protein n=1 Tax=Eutrema salsugineum TaxID=72664 RepID=V4K4G2_EUTSA|nr:RPM1-interacting protein 4 [Eutrema salsugineum]ESQ32435.1 hypothetical protein EUTSA_v10004864mg [Eutrema salsugineum]